MSSLLDRLKKTSTVKQTALLTDSILMNERDMCKTEVPVLNIALSGSVNGGLCDGLTVVAGESKTFKSNLSLLMASAYLKEHEDAALLLYDSEFGITPEYLESMHIDTSRVIHTPVEHLEQLKFDLVKQMTELDRKDKVVVVVDSIGNLASKKELTDVLDQKSKSDMTRAKEVKALFRQVTPYLTTKACPLIVIAHTYKSQDLYPTDVLAGGTGLMYSANQVLIMGKQNIKNTDTKSSEKSLGSNFMLGVMKSRFCKEKTRLPLEITWDNGINVWSGLLDIAVELGAVVKPSNGWYSKVDLATGEAEDKKYRKADTNTAEFWQPLLDNGFSELIEKRYKISSDSILKDGGDSEEDKSIDEEFNEEFGIEPPKKKKAPAKKKS